MPAKIILTGHITGKVREETDYFAFEMIEGGSSSAPKGLPLASQSIEYTIFVSKKAAKKAELKQLSTDKTLKWLIQGELILDLAINECPGEIGVIAFQIQTLPTTEKGELNETKQPEKPSTSILQNESKQQTEPKTNIELIVTKQPMQTNPIATLPIQAIEVPAAFRANKPRQEKLLETLQFIELHGHLDKPVTVKKTGNQYVLVDGYKRFYVAEELKWSEIEAMIV